MSSDTPSHDERQAAETPSAPNMAMFSPFWCFYADAAGNRVQLAMAVVDGKVVLTTASGEVLTFSGVELGMLLENLEAIAGRRPSV
ncbi:hypothetical protein [Kutzneria sp. NPDC052558]|uniref:hypothetical protein n=1 Tax=Kutzneria sp. NPDC052558 TaxID=3364121 RepID=UPI0037CC108E